MVDDLTQLGLLCSNMLCRESLQIIYEFLGDVR